MNDDAQTAWNDLESFRATLGRSSVLYGWIGAARSDRDRLVALVGTLADALREIEHFTFDVMDTDEYQSGKMKDIARAALEAASPSSERPLSGPSAKRRAVIDQYDTRPH